MIGSLYSNNRVSLPCKSEKQLVITLGGDGVMLRALHAFVGDDVDIYGINLGSVGFLLNNYDLKNLLKNIETSIQIHLSPLEMKVKTTDGQIHKAIAFNEISLLRSTAQTAKIKISVNGKVRLDELSGDGLLVSTAAGSTAYNAAAHGPILPLNSNILVLTPISPFRPRRMSSILLQRQSLVTLMINEFNKRPVSTFADLTEIKNVEIIQIYERSDIKVSILFDCDSSPEERILKEQFIN
jgi:NAD+ kinase